MFIEILQYGFVVIFFVTAFIGLASLPEWIKIPEWYRKRIFIALLLEVTALILIIFNQELVAPFKSPPGIEVSPKGWVALDDKASIIQPQLTIETQDSILNYELGRPSLRPFNNLNSHLTPDGMKITNSDGIALGILPYRQLNNLGLFNAIETAKNEISSSENYAYVRWEKKPKVKTSPQWKMYGSYLSPFHLKIFDSDGRTEYIIQNSKTKDTLFVSHASSKNLFDVDNRLNHFFRYEDSYFLFRINAADLCDRSQNYIHVLQIRFQPTLKE